MSDTPRTDALFPSQRTADDRVAVWVEIGWIRDIERELNAARARIAELEEDLERTRNERNRAGMDARKAVMDQIKEHHVCALHMDMMGRCFVCGKVNKEIEAMRIKEEQERNDPNLNTPPPVPKEETK